MSHRCACLEYLPAIAISAALFCVRPPFCDYSGDGEHSTEGGFAWATTAIQTLRVASMKKLLNIVYWIGVAVSLELISFEVCCHFTVDAIMRIPFVFLPRLCWPNDRSLLCRTFAATKEVSPTRSQ